MLVVYTADLLHPSTTFYNVFVYVVGAHSDSRLHRIQCAREKILAFRLACYIPITTKTNSRFCFSFEIGPWHQNCGILLLLLLLSVITYTFIALMNQQM